MRLLTRQFLGVWVAAAALLAVGEGSATATTFCVPTFSPACTNSGGNVAEADLEKAMNTSDGDGVADTIVIAAGTVTESGSFEPSSGFKNPASIEPVGSDPLTVIGAGPAATIVTSSGSGNVYLLALAAGSRQVEMRDLTLRIPASFDDGLGAALQMDNGAVLENVDIVSLNPGSDGVAAVFEAGNVYRDGDLRGEGGGSLDDAIRTGSGGEVLVEDTTMQGVSWGLIAAGPGSEVTARRVSQVGTRVYGAVASAGTVTVENSVFRIDDGFAFHSWPDADSASIEADHVTVLNSGGATRPAVEVKKTTGAGNAAVTVTNSIMRGFKSGFSVEGTAGPGIGVASFTARHSNFQIAGSNSGVLDLGTTNLDADPLFAADLSLSPGSPSIDKGDPAAGGLAVDFLGAPRPNDGNGDGNAIRDQGAFEYQRPATPGGGGSGSGDGGGDGTKPKVQGLKGPGKALADGKAKFRFRANESGSKFVCKLDRRKTAACKSPKSYAGLKPGRHTFKVWAVDRAGNKSAKPAKRTFRVPA